MDTPIIQSMPPSMTVAKLNSISSFVARVLSEPCNPVPGTVLISYLLYRMIGAGFHITDATVYVVAYLVAIGSCVVIKRYFPSERPAIATEYPWDGWLKLTEPTNIPSGHSLTGVFWGMVALNASNDPITKVVGAWLVSLPLLRYIGRQHTIEGVAAGSAFGLGCYFCIKSMI